MISPQVKTALTHTGTAVGSALAVLTWASTHSVDLYAIVDQVNTVVVDITKLVATVTPFVTAAYGIYRSSTKVRMAESVNDPKAVQVAAALPVTPQTVAIADALKKE